MKKSVFQPRKPKGFVARADKLYPEIYRAVKHLLHDDFFILNIGANDGVENDPIHAFLMMYPMWRGVAVEPVRYNFVQLANNYQRYPGITVVQAAVCNEAKPLYCIDEESGCDMRWAGQICSFNRDYVVDSIKGLRIIAPESVTDDAEQHILEDQSINCISLQELVRRHHIERVDFLNIDAETHDFEIFAAFDLARFRPAIICIETACFSATQKAEFARMMAEHEYMFVSEFEWFSEIYIRNRQS